VVAHVVEPIYFAFIDRLFPLLLGLCESVEKPNIRSKLGTIKDHVSLSIRAELQAAMLVRIYCSEQTPLDKSFVGGAVDVLKKSILPPSPLLQMGQRSLQRIHHPTMFASHGVHV